MAPRKTPENNKVDPDQLKLDLKPVEKPVLSEPLKKENTPVLWRVLGYKGHPTGRRYDSAKGEFLDESKPEQ